VKGVGRTDGPTIVKVTLVSTAPREFINLDDLWPSPVERLNREFREHALAVTFVVVSP